MQLPPEKPVRAAQRIILNAVEGWGKTSAGAYAPNPVVLMAAGETGYDTLYQFGLVPRVPTISISDWADLLSETRALIGTDRQTVVFDAIGGFEKMCQLAVCVRDCKGDWTNKGFGDYQVGYRLSGVEWTKLLVVLDKLRGDGKTILMLSHSRTKSSKNPDGADFYRHVADCQDIVWGITADWADAVFFGTFVVATEKVGGKEKGIGGDQRIIHVTHGATWDAKNRYGLDRDIDIPNDHTKVWSTLWSAIEGRK